MSEFCRLQDGIWVIICPVCESIQPAADNQPVDEPVYCNIICDWIGHLDDPVELGAENPSRDDAVTIRRIDDGEPQRPNGGSENPSRNDGVTMTCPICWSSFRPSGRRRYCSDACKAAAWRRRHEAPAVQLVVPRSQPRRPLTVYECDECGARALGEQRCEPCASFMRRVGIGGLCIHCDEPLAVSDLVPREVMRGIT
jgi:hypothetical protein